MTVDTMLTLLKEYGPGMFGWVLFLTLLGWLAGRGGQLALKNVEKMLLESENLRQRMKTTLDEYEIQLKARDETISELRTTLETARQTIVGLQEEMIALRTKHRREVLQAEEEAASLRMEVNLLRSRGKRRGERG